MADASLNIPITADASKFLSTLGQVEDRLKELKVALKDAVGADIGKINFEIQGLEQQKKSFKEFGKFAEGTYGRLLQQLDYLNRYKLTLGVDSPELAKTVAEINNIQETINKVNGKGIKIDVEIVQPPKGSIQYYEDRIKALRAERVVFTSDSTSLERANLLIDEYTKRVSSLKTKGISVPVVVDEEIAENSILRLRKRIDELNAKKIRIGITNEGDIAKLTSEIKGLEQEIQRVDNLTIDEKGGISKNANKARQTLTNLKLVAQDLPFGFIAIQNNLPNLLESFGELNTKSGGLKGALKDLGTQLVGPAGIFLAFSVVTAAITYAIKEYGSLSNAVKVLTGANADAIKAQLEFNKALSSASGNIGGDIAKINLFVKTIQSETSTQEQKIAAYRSLLELNPKVVAGIDEQNLSTAKSIELIGKNAQAVLELLKLQTKSAGISKALDTLEQRRFEANGVFNRAREKQIKLQQRLDEIDAKRGRGQRLTQLENNQSANRNNLIKDYEEDVVNARDAISAITKEQDKWYKGLEPTATAISNINSGLINQTNALDAIRNAQKENGKNVFVPEIDARQLDEAYNLDTIISNLTKYGNAVVDVNKTEKERQNALKELIEINPKYFESFKLGVTPISKVREALEELILSLRVEKREREDALRVSQLNAQFRKQEEKGIESLGSKYGTLNKEVSAFPTTMEEINSQLDENVKATNRVVEGIVPLANINRATEPLKFLQEQFQLAYTAINQVFFAPLENLFETFLTKGEITFKDFAKAVGKSIADIAAKLAATGVIKGLLFLLDPSGALAGFGGSFGGAGGGNGILDALGGVFGRSQRKPDFNRVSPPRTYGGDRVEFTIRGTNLVGVLNRANGEINRIG
jgi:hypothetical protein